MRILEVLALQPARAQLACTCTLAKCLLIHVLTYNLMIFNETLLCIYGFICVYIYIIVAHRLQSFYVSFKGRQPRKAILEQETRPRAVRSSMSVESTAPQS